MISDERTDSRAHMTWRRRHAPRARAAGANLRAKGLLLSPSDFGRGRNGRRRGATARHQSKHRRRNGELRLDFGSLPEGVQLTLAELPVLLPAERDGEAWVSAWRSLRGRMGGEQLVLARNSLALLQQLEPSGAPGVARARSE